MSLAPSPPRRHEEEVLIPAGCVRSSGLLTRVDDALGLVLFAHGSGSSRTSPRNLAVARWLAEGGMSTLLFDLLTPEESLERANVFDVPLLAQRLRAATDWVRQQLPSETPLGYFGASTGAAAAIWAATEPGASVAALVSRGGRPDLAEPRLASLRTPTLLIVGGHDLDVLHLNRLAYERIPAEKRLEIVPGATHLFEEPGALQTVAQLARDWFAARLMPRSGRTAASS